MLRKQAINPLSLAKGSNNTEELNAIQDLLKLKAKLTRPTTTIGFVVKTSAREQQTLVWFLLSSWGFLQVESYQWLKNWYPSGYPVRRLVLYGQYWVWLARCEYTVSRWDRKWSAISISVWQHVQLSRSTPEIHWHVYWDIKQASKQPSTPPGCTYCLCV